MRAPRQNRLRTVSWVQSISQGDTQSGDTRIEEWCGRPDETLMHMSCRQDAIPMHARCDLDAIPMHMSCGLDAINDFICVGDDAGLPQSTPQCNKVNAHQSRERTMSLPDTSSLAFAGRPRSFLLACVSCSHRCQTMAQGVRW